MLSLKKNIKTLKSQGQNEDQRLDASMIYIYVSVSDRLMNILRRTPQKGKTESYLVGWKRNIPKISLIITANNHLKYHC